MIDPRPVALDPRHPTAAELKAQDRLLLRIILGLQAFIVISVAGMSGAWWLLILDAGLTLFVWRRSRI